MLGNGALIYIHTVYIHIYSSNYCVFVLMKLLPLHTWSSCFWLSFSFYWRHTLKWLAPLLYLPYISTLGSSTCTRPTWILILPFSTYLWTCAALLVVWSTKTINSINHVSSQRIKKRANQSFVSIITKTTWKKLCTFLKYLLIYIIVSIS